VKGRETGGKDRRGGEKNPPFKMPAYGPGYGAFAAYIRFCAYK